MKKPSYYFHRVSLTKQVLTIILISTGLFAAFFFFVLGSSIDETIDNQMFDMLSNNQRPIIALAENTSKFNENIYDFITEDSVQTNCFISDDQITVIGNQKVTAPKKLYAFLVDASASLTEHKSVIEGVYKNGKQTFYYRMVLCKTQAGQIIVASFMDSTYPSSFRSTLISSTVDVIIIAFLLIFLVIIIWVFSLIRPLNQIKDYIEKVNEGKEVELNIVRGDEIGQLADSIVTMKDELTKQEKAKEEMIHNISHDLKTPIATIKSYGESIKDGIYPYGDLESSVDVIIDNANRLEKKVYNLLYLNRIEYLLTSDAEGVCTNMKEVVQEVVLNSAVIRPEIEVYTDVEEVYFEGLLEAWRVCIENIMDNAFRYAQSYIKIEVHENDLRISNDGPKMDEKRIQTLFRPFEKGEKGKFGLGLSIVSKVTKTNHYIVEGYNTDDGVCFRIYRKPVEVKKPRASWQKKGKGE